MYLAMSRESGRECGTLSGCSLSVRVHQANQLLSDQPQLSAVTDLEKKLQICDRLGELGNSAYLMCDSYVKREDLVWHPAHQDDNGDKRTDLGQDAPPGRHDSRRIAVARDAQH